MTMKTWGFNIEKVQDVLWNAVKSYMQSLLPIYLRLIDDGFIV